MIFNIGVYIATTVTKLLGVSKEDQNVNISYFPKSLHY